MMKTTRLFRNLVVASSLLLTIFRTVTAQNTQPPAAHNDSANAVLSSPYAEKGLFETNGVLHITLSGNIRPLLNNRVEEPVDYALTLSYTRPDSSICAIPVDVRTRGHFRRLQGNCNYPPLMVRFAKEGAPKNSIFREQHKLKLVMPCVGDKYVIREWLVYQLYNLVTTKSFRARLVNVTLKDDKSKKPGATFYGILLEEVEQMAERNGMVEVERQLGPQQTQREDFLMMATFEYLIGNTDWSVQYLQNIKLIAVDSTAAPVAVPYDFDHAGIVDAPYARPAEELLMRSIRQRRYRGYCIQNMKAFEGVVARYNLLKNDIYSLYTSCHLLDEKYVKSTLAYLDAFYATLNDPVALEKDFSYPCDSKGTGKVVIRGLKKN